MSESQKELCIWCKKNPRKDGYALCEHCYELQEADEKRRDRTIHFICPLCKEDIGNRTICPKCGIIRYMLMSLPSHCNICHSQFWYHLNNDINSKRYCWSCNSPFKESSIDQYIMYALQHFEDFNKEKTKN